MAPSGTHKIIQSLSLRDNEVVLLNNVPFDAVTIKMIQAILEMDEPIFLQRDIYLGIHEILMISLQDRKHEPNFNGGFIEANNYFHELLLRLQPLYELYLNNRPKGSFFSKAG